jgi:type VI secretion system protein ImpA
MALSTEFDVEYLLAPFPGDHPAGVDPRGDNASGDLRTVRDIRDDARRIERKADDNGEEPLEAKPMWREVRDLSMAVLAEQSKDLEAASYLIEAIIRTDSFEGLAMGFRVLRELIQGMWDDIYPHFDPEESDEDSRIADRLRSITRLNGGGEAAGLLPPVLARVPITSERASVGPFACWHYKQATELAKKPLDEQTTRINQGAVSMAVLDRAVNESPPQFYGELLAGLRACETELKQLDDVLTEKLGSRSPSWSAIREELEECARVVRLIAKGRIPEDTAPAAETDGAVAGAGGTPGGTSQPGGLNTREDAFRMLELVAAFFEKMDPQSLLAVQIRNTIRLGRMSPEEYFRELIKDSSAREQLFEAVGIKPQSSS